MSARAAATTPTTPTDLPALLHDVSGVAARLRVSETQAYRLMWDGAIRSVKIGRSRRVSEAALVEYIAKLENQSGAR